MLGFQQLCFHFSLVFMKVSFTRLGIYNQNEKQMCKVTVFGKVDEEQKDNDFSIRSNRQWQHCLHINLMHIMFLLKNGIILQFACTAFPSNFSCFNPL